MSAKPASLEGRIRQHWDQLSLHEQRLADILLAAPGQLAMNTATELAQSAGVSKATATRFFVISDMKATTPHVVKLAKCKTADRHSICKRHLAHHHSTV